MTEAKPKGKKNKKGKKREKQLTTGAKNLQLALMFLLIVVVHLAWL